jgi:threonine dehydrogenase-like Zn-dependent dehydrogenase
MRRETQHSSGPGQPWAESGFTDHEAIGDVLDLEQWSGKPALVLGTTDCGFVVEVYHRDAGQGAHQWAVVNAVGGMAEYIVTDRYPDLLAVLGEVAPIATAALLTLQYDRQADTEEEEEA